MRKYIALIATLVLMTIGLDAQSGRRSGMTSGINSYIETTDFDSLHVGAGMFVYGATGSGQEVTATGDELNYLDIGALGTGAASKAVVLDAGDDFTWPATGLLTYWGTAITSTGLELNVLDGIAATLTSDELDYLDISALGTGVASKAVVLDAGDDYTWPATGILTYGVLNDGTTTLTTTVAQLNAIPATTATAGELDYNAGVTAGTGLASKTMVLDAGDDFTWPATGILTYWGTAILATGLEINVLDGIAGTLTFDELDYLDIGALGTGAASKAVVLDAGEDYIWPATGILTYGGSTVTSTGTELSYTDITTLGTQEASKVVTTDAQSNSGISKVTQLWIGSSGAEAQVLSTAAELAQRALTVKMIDVSSAGQVHVVSPYAGDVTAVYSVLNATIATAPAGITIKDKDGNVMGTITITDGGSGPGDVDSDVSIANADVAVGDMIEIETDNASTNTVEVEFTILIAIQ